MENANLLEMSFTDLLDIYTTRCEELGKEPDDSHKTKEALIEAINKLSTDEGNDTPEGGQGVGSTTEGNGDKQQKYNSSGKRGPNQGIGAFAKEQIALGKTNQDVLNMIADKFPSARTSMSCIAYYRNAIKKGGSAKGSGGAIGDPAALRAKAAELLARADELEKQMKDNLLKGDIESKIREEVEARIRQEVEAKYAEIRKQMEADKQNMNEATTPPDMTGLKIEGTATVTEGADQAQPTEAQQAADDTTPASSQPA